MATSCKCTKCYINCISYANSCKRNIYRIWIALKSRIIIWIFRLLLINEGIYWLDFRILFFWANRICLTFYWFSRNGRIWYWNYKNAGFLRLGCHKCLIRYFSRCHLIICIRSRIWRLLYSWSIKGYC